MKRSYSLEDLAVIVENEGLGYAIDCYVSPEQIIDEEMRGLWIQCNKLMHVIKSRLPEFPD